MVEEATVSHFTKRDLYLYDDHFHLGKLDLKERLYSMFVSRCSSEKSETGVSVCRMDTFLTKKRLYWMNENEEISSSGYYVCFST